MGGWGGGGMTLGAPGGFFFFFGGARIAVGFGFCTGGVVRGEGGRELWEGGGGSLGRGKRRDQLHLADPLVFRLY